ncbi:MAG: hypothetical protein ACE37K_26265 [Planctomycetota bacterium]
MTRAGHEPAGTSERRPDERGMLLIEALVAMLIVATVTIAYIGIRSTALIDATRARNWRLAREIADEKMSELQAGAHELPPESGLEIPIDKYEGFSFKIVLGESAVADAEGQVAEEAAGDDTEAQDRVEWARNRDDYRRARERGLSAQEYEDQQLDDINERLAEKAPSADDLEECAVIVYFPKFDPAFEGQKSVLLIKSRVSTLAISGMTPDQASALQQANGETADPSSSGASSPFGGQPGGGDGR